MSQPLVRNGCLNQVVINFRNVYRPDEMLKYGFDYYSVASYLLGFESRGFIKQRDRMSLAHLLQFGPGRVT
jgi:hypothetical protein